MSDAELLASMREAAREELLFFSNKRKSDRERWVVSQFLELCSVPVAEGELTSPPQSSKTDVHFRGANFQVKEIVTPGSKRSDEVKAIYNRLAAATKLEDTIGPSFVYDVPPTTTIYSLVVEEASCRATKYADTRHELDLLFYVTRTRASPIRQVEICVEQLAALGWRSISCLAGTQATVLLAQDDAPAFLRAKTSR